MRGQLVTWAPHPLCTLSAGGRTVRKLGADGWDCLVYNTQPVRGGRHTFKLKLDLLHRDVMGVSFGVLPLGADPAVCHNSAPMYNGRRVRSLKRSLHAGNCRVGEWDHGPVTHAARTSVQHGHVGCCAMSPRFAHSHGMLVSHAPIASPHMCKLCVVVIAVGGRG